jgi:MHS family proline/betaine transporter-like MFS transporter
LIVGLLLVAGLTAAVSEEALASWAWRVPFLVALPLGLIGLYMRLRLEDTPAFQAVQEHHEVERAPLKESLRAHGKDLLKIVGLTWPLTGLVYLLIFAPTYLSEQIGMSLSLAYTAVVLGTASWIVVVLLSAVISDRIGRRKPFLLASPILTALAAVPVFMLLQSGSFPASTVALVIVGCVVGLATGVYAAAMCEIFPTSVRYSSLSLGYSVAVSIFGGTTPLIFTALLAATGNPISPAFYLVAAGIAGFVAALVFPETAEGPLRET